MALRPRFAAQITENPTQSLQDAALAAFKEAMSVQDRAFDAEFECTGSFHQSMVVHLMNLSRGDLETEAGKTAAQRSWDALQMLLNDRAAFEADFGDSREAAVLFKEFKKACAVIEPVMSGLEETPEEADLLEMKPLVDDLMASLDGSGEHEGTVGASGGTAEGIPRRERASGGGTGTPPVDPPEGGGGGPERSEETPEEKFARAANRAWHQMRSDLIDSDTGQHVLQAVVRRGYVEEQYLPFVDEEKSVPRTYEGMVRLFDLLTTSFEHLEGGWNNAHRESTEAVEKMDDAIFAVFIAVTTHITPLLTENERLYSPDKVLFPSRWGQAFVRNERHAWDNPESSFSIRNAGKDTNSYTIFRSTLGLKDTPFEGSADIRRHDVAKVELGNFYKAIGVDPLEINLYNQLNRSARPAVNTFQLEISRAGNEEEFKQLFRAATNHLAPVLEDVFGERFGPGSALRPDLLILNAEDLERYLGFEEGSISTESGEVGLKIVEGKLWSICDGADTDTVLATIAPPARTPEEEGTKNDRLARVHNQLVAIQSRLKNAEAFSNGAKSNLSKSIDKFLRQYKFAHSMNGMVGGHIHAAIKAFGDFVRCLAKAAPQSGGGVKGLLHSIAGRFGVGEAGLMAGELERALDEVLPLVLGYQDLGKKSFVQVSRAALQFSGKFNMIELGFLKDPFIFFPTKESLMEPDSAPEYVLAGKNANGEYERIPGYKFDAILRKQPYDYDDGDDLIVPVDVAKDVTATFATAGEAAAALEAVVEPYDEDDASTLLEAVAGAGEEAILEVRNEGVLQGFLNDLITKRENPGFLARHGFKRAQKRHAESLTAFIQNERERWEGQSIEARFLGDMVPGLHDALIGYSYGEDEIRTNTGLQLIYLEDTDEWLIQPVGGGEHLPIYIRGDLSGFEVVEQTDSEEGPTDEFEPVAVPPGTSGAQTADELNAGLKQASRRHWRRQAPRRVALRAGEILTTPLADPRKRGLFYPVAAYLGFAVGAAAMSEKLAPRQYYASNQVALDAREAELTQGHLDNIQYVYGVQNYVIQAEQTILNVEWQMNHVAHIDQETLRILRGSLQRNRSVLNADRERLLELKGLVPAELKHGEESVDINELFERVNEAHLHADVLIRQLDEMIVDEPQEVFSDDEEAWFGEGELAEVKKTATGLAKIGGAIWGVGVSALAVGSLAVNAVLGIRRSKKTVGVKPARKALLSRTSKLAMVGALMGGLSANAAFKNAYGEHQSDEAAMQADFDELKAAHLSDKANFFKAAKSLIEVNSDLIELRDELQTATDPDFITQTWMQNFKEANAVLDDNHQLMKSSKAHLPEEFSFDDETMSKSEQLKKADELHDFADQLEAEAAITKANLVLEELDSSFVELQRRLAAAQSTEELDAILQSAQSDLTQLESAQQAIQFMKAKEAYAVLIENIGTERELMIAAAQVVPSASVQGTIVAAGEYLVDPSTVTLDADLGYAENTLWTTAYKTVAPCTTDLAGRRLLASKLTNQGLTENMDLIKDVVERMESEDRSGKRFTQVMAVIKGYMTIPASVTTFGDLLGAHEKGEVDDLVLGHVAAFDFTQAEIDVTFGFAAMNGGSYVSCDTVRAF